MYQSVEQMLNAKYPYAAKQRVMTTKVKFRDNTEIELTPVWNRLSNGGVILLGAHAYFDGVIYFCEAPRKY